MRLNFREGIQSAAEPNALMPPMLFCAVGFPINVHNFPIVENQTIDSQSKIMGTLAYNLLTISQIIFNSSIIIC